MKTGSAEVFQHEIPTSSHKLLRWALAISSAPLKKAFAVVNDMFGDIVKVTPFSKVAGDMAQFMVANDLSADDTMQRGDSLYFPESVEGFLWAKSANRKAAFLRSYSALF